jgi:hypothetical protein
MTQSGVNRSNILNEGHNVKFAIILQILVIISMGLKSIKHVWIQTNYRIENPYKHV